MKHETVVKKVIARLGVNPEEGYNGKWYAEYNGKIISWYAKEAWNEPGVLEATLFHVRSVGDETCLQTDYFAGSFRDNATQMINSVCPPPNKYPVGCLVRGKYNKRAIRCGYAGFVGLVTKDSSGGYAYVKWHGVGTVADAMSYSERDLELVSKAA